MEHRRNHDDAIKGEDPAQFERQQPVSGDTCHPHLLTRTIAMLIRLLMKRSIY
jgi:hypothetical protein